MAIPAEASALAEQADRELLERHAPVLRYDPQDLFRAISAEAAVANAGNLLLDGDGELIARARGRDGADDASAATADALGLQTLADYPGRDRPADERLALAQSYAGDARRMQARGQPFSRRVHGRVHRGGDGSAWLQYWLFYYYNPKNLRGFGKHEGDWEMIQVHLDPDGRPDRATYAQHEFGESRSWDEVERQGEHPLVYVGQLSHASYFDRGSFPYAIARPYLPLGIDHALGGKIPDQPPGPEERPRVDPLPANGWPHWPGRWGSGERALLLFGRIGDGPGSPANQGPKWSDPDGFHRRQRRLSRTVRRAVGRLTHFIGRWTYPDPPRLKSAIATGDRVEVVCEPEAHRAHRTRYVLLTVNEADGNELVLVSRVVRPKAEGHEHGFRLRDARRPLRVWASAFNGPRQRSDPVSLEVGPPAPR